MKKIILLLFASVLLMTSCDNYSISGNLSSDTFNGKSIYLINADSNEVLDSAIVADQQFHFSGNVKQSTPCILKIGQSNLFMILEKGDILADFSSYKASNTPLNDQYNSCIDTDKQMIKEAMTSRVTLAPEEYKNFIENDWIPRYIQAMKGFYEPNKNNYVGYLSFMNLCQYLPQNELDMLIDEATPSILAYPEVQKLIERLKAN